MVSEMDPGSTVRQSEMRFHQSEISRPRMRMPAGGTPMGASAHGCADSAALTHEQRRRRARADARTQVRTRNSARTTTARRRRQRSYIGAPSSDCALAQGSDVSDSAGWSVGQQRSQREVRQRCARQRRRPQLRSAHGSGRAQRAPSCTCAVAPHREAPRLRYWARVARSIMHAAPSHTTPPPPTDRVRCTDVTKSREHEPAHTPPGHCTS